MKQHLHKMVDKVRYLFCLKFKASPPLIFLFICLGSFLGANQVQAQHNIDNPNQGSDYQIEIAFYGFSTDRCKCEETRTLKGYAGGYRNGTPIYQSGALGTSGKLLLVKGPGFSQEYYFTAHYDGITRNNGCTCTVAAGLCPAVTCHEYTDIIAQTLRTAAIKSPESLTATNGTYDNQVVLTWAKGSDIPNQYLEYKV